MLLDPDSLRVSLEQAGVAALGIGFAAGFVFSFNPVALAAIPVSLAYVTKAHDSRRAVALGAMFVLGMIVTHAFLGLAASLGGSWVQHLLGRAWGLVLGPVLIVLGLMWPGWIRLPAPAIRFTAKRATTLWGAFSLGVPFSVAICPVCTPALVVLLGVVVGVASPVFGVTLLLAFAMGRAIPIVFGAWAVGLLEGLKGLSRMQRPIEIAGGVALILSGLYMLNAYFFLIPSLAA